MVSSSCTRRQALREQLVALAVDDDQLATPRRRSEVVEVARRRMMLADGPKLRDVRDLLRRNQCRTPRRSGAGPAAARHAARALTFGAQFAEVAVDADLGLVRVRRLVGAFAPGRVLNPKTGAEPVHGRDALGNQPGAARRHRMDSRYGRWAQEDLGEYLVTVNADAPDVSVEFVDVEDAVVGPLGVKGVGEIGQVGVAAAIANAVFHATGRRVRELPISPELVMQPAPTAGTA